MEVVEGDSCAAAGVVTTGVGGVGAVTCSVTPPDESEDSD